MSWLFSTKNLSIPEFDSEQANNWVKDELLPYLSEMQENRQKQFDRMFEMNSDLHHANNKLMEIIEKKDEFISGLFDSDEKP